MTTAAEDYSKARKLGTKEYQKCISDELSPYLPVLDEMVESRTLLKEESIGTREIPLAQVIGTVTKGRQEAFARNFMPLLAPDSEFGNKWISLMAYQTKEGIQEPIKVIEYLGKFYVLEGNKRVSVMKYLEMPTILATVTRVLPAPSEDKEVVIYNEFLKFFKCTQIYDFIFSEEGSYEKLAAAVEKNLDCVWDEDSILDLKSAFIKFKQAYAPADGKKIKQITNADAFLVYIEMFKYSDLVNATVDEIKKNLDQIWPEIKIADNGNQIEFSEEPKLEKESSIPIIDTLIDSIFTKTPYSKEHPLNILFIHNGDASISRWINGHEQGRKELEEKFPEVVRTLSCNLKDATEEEFEEAIDAAATDGVELVFSTSPVQMEYVLRAAVKYPKIKFLNCSVSLSREAVRTYYGRMYEAKFLLGVLAATLAIDHKIGYVSTYPVCGNIANINAFAIGAAMADPLCEIYLTWSCLKDDTWRDYVKRHNLKIISGPDLIRPTKADAAYGLFMIDDEDNITNIAFPEWKWGKYYELIVQLILNDAWTAETDELKDKAINYWWGMSSGVIDIKLVDENIPYTTKKLINAIRKTITADIANPFDGELWSQFKQIRDAESTRLTNEEIINMNWLADNVIGTIPTLEEMTETAQKTVKANGMPIISNINGDKE